MNDLAIDAKRDRTFWRGMYLIAFVIGVVIPIASIIAAGAMTDDALARLRYNQSYPPSSTFVVLFLAWSAATLLSILGMSSAAWIVTSTGEKLGIDRGRSYLRGMFLMAFASGGVLPVAAIIAVGATSSEMSRVEVWLLIVAWGGMLSVCIAGVCCAIWLVRTAAQRLGIASGSGLPTTDHEPQYACGAADIR